MKNRLVIALSLLLLLSTFNLSKNSNSNSKFKIKELRIDNNKTVSSDEIKKKLSYLYEKNFFFFKSKNIEKKLAEIEIIDGFKIKKIYPDTLKIKIFEKSPIAIIQNKQEKYFFTSKGEIINFSNIGKFKNLPIVFGDRENFKIFLKSLNEIDFPVSEIKTFYLFNSGRWDLVTKKNQTINLPIQNYKESIKNYLYIKDQANFNKYKIFDYRINDQLILK